MRNDTAASTVSQILDRAFAKAGAVSPHAAQMAAGRLLRQGRLAEAEVMLAAAVAAFPRHAGLAAAHAATAQMDGRLAVAALRWRRVCELRPHNQEAWRRLAECARDTADIEGANEAAGRALALRPNDWRVLFEVAHAHDCAARHDAAAPFWARLTTRFPRDPIFRQSYAHCLMRLGRLDEAEREIAAGSRHHRDHQVFAVARGVLAMRRENWDEAHAIWTDYVAAYPDELTGRDYLDRVDRVRRLEAAAHARPEQHLIAPIDVGRVEDERVRRLMLRFESIGSDCEFGCVQRRYGAEPLALLRWSDVTIPSLSAALSARFAGMGTPETTALEVDAVGLLYVRDRRWGLGMHTFLYTHEVSPEAALPKLCKRVAYLRDKFIDDLAAAEKILVFKSSALRFEDLTRLHEQLRGYGPVRLLHVRPAVTAGIPPWPQGGPGIVAELAPDLYVGYLDRMGDLADFAFDTWTEVCSSLCELIDGPATAARDASAIPAVA